MLCFAPKKTWKIENLPIYSIAKSWNERILRWFFLIPGLEVYGVPMVRPGKRLLGRLGRQASLKGLVSAAKRGNHYLNRNGHWTSLNTIIEHLWKWGNTSLNITLWGKGWKTSFLKHLETIYQTKPQFFWFIDTCEHCPKPREKRKQIPKHS